MCSGNVTGEESFHVHLRYTSASKVYSLSQVSASAGLLSPVRLTDTEGVPQGRDAGLQIELGGLCQVRLLTKVVEGKQC